MNIDELKKISSAERIQRMEALWDSMLYEGGEIDTPEWHTRILEQRKKAITGGSAKFVPISELKASRGQ
ncbi:addiction module component, TIGR02574 family [Desulfosarcina variabilis str. Montpellier]|uniref:addiction module protein n=1 Tax=Desulfosarcina variabilis TaxID=2300 RepID=UPI003AFB28FD